MSTGIIVMGMVLAFVIIMSIIDLFDKEKREKP